MVRLPFTLFCFAIVKASYIKTKTELVEAPADVFWNSKNAFRFDEYYFPIDGDSENHNHEYVIPEREDYDVIDSINPGQDLYPNKCTNKELEKLLSRCLVIWRGYCDCVGCKKSCGKDKWPPSETTDWKLTTNSDRVVGWESRETSWKWVFKCAYNATYIWRDFTDFCKEEATFEYWYLTRLSQTTDHKTLKNLCKSECRKSRVKNVATTISSSTHSYGNTETVKLQISDETITAAGITTVNTYTETKAGESILPTSVGIVIGFLGAFVLIFGFTLCFIIWKKKTKRERSRQDVDLYPSSFPQTTPCVSKHNSVKESTQPKMKTFEPTSIIRQFSGDDDIYQTIPESHARNEQPINFYTNDGNLTISTSAGSVQNVLYQDSNVPSPSSVTFPSPAVYDVVHRDGHLPGIPQGSTRGPDYFDVTMENENIPRVTISPPPLDNFAHKNAFK